MVNQRVLSATALFASLFALGVIALGAFTRLIDGGLGCPDWPGCYGHLIVPLTDKARSLAAIQYPETPLTYYKAWAEMIHRYFVGMLSLLIVAIILMIVSKKTLRSTTNLVLSCFLILLLSYQITLGQWTVTLKLLPVIVSQHLLGGFLILSTLWVIYLKNRYHPVCSHSTHSSVVRYSLPWAYVALFVIFAQIVLGAWTSTNYASLSCPDFPFCVNDQVFSPHFKAAFNLFSPVGINYDGGVLPQFIRQTIQMVHRVGALIVTLYLFVFSAVVMPKIKKIPALSKSIYIVLGLLCIQLCLGISNVVFKLPLAVAVAHNLVAALLLLSIITFIYKLQFQFKARTS